MVKAAEKADYGVPEGVLGLTGPVDRPAPGTLPLRGDLAHIALAGTHLAAHYVIPTRVNSTAHIELKLQQNADSETVGQIASGSALELLDVQGEWAWVCEGPSGPSGFVPLAKLAAAA